MLRFKLLELLEQKNMSQKTLSLLTGIRPATISALCNNKDVKMIGVTTIDKICDVLDCNPNDLMEHTPSRSRHLLNEAINTILEKTFTVDSNQLKEVEKLFREKFGMSDNENE